MKRAVGDVFATLPHWASCFPFFSLFSLTGIGYDITVGAFVLLEREPGQVEPGHNLDRILVLPLVDQVVFRPTV